MTKELYINGELVDLPTSVLALSFAVNTLDELKTLNGSITNRVTLPWTARNKKVLGFVGNFNVDLSKTARRKLIARYVQNGIEVIPYGAVQVGTATERGVDIVITSGNIDFFDLLTGKLRELDFSEYDHLWNSNNVINSRLNTYGFLYPWINYGNISNNTETVSGQHISTNEMRPAMFAKSVVEKIIEEVGYTLDNQIVNNNNMSDLYDNLLLPFSGDKFEHSKRYFDEQAKNDISVKKTAYEQYTQPGPGSGNDYFLNFDTVITDGLHRFYDAHSFRANELMTVDVNVVFDKIDSQTLDGNHRDGAYYEIRVRRDATGNTDIINREQTKIEDPDVVITNGGAPGAPGTHYKKTFRDFQVSATGIILNTGDVVYMNVATLYGCFQDVYPNVAMTIKRSVDLNFGESVQVESVLPDLSQKDFLKFISFLFCAIIQADNNLKTVSIVPFGTIVKNVGLAKDWSDKVTGGYGNRDIYIGDYAQVNEAIYKEDDAVVPATTGNGTFTIADKNLDDYKEIYSMPFAASLDGLVMGGYTTTTIKKISDTTVLGVNGLIFDTNTQERIVVLNKKNVNMVYRRGENGTFVNISDNIPFTFFTSTSNGPDLTMTQVFARHYPDLIRVLNDQRKINIPVSLTEEDIQELNFFIPVYLKQYGCYFYISKVKDYTGIKPPTVELIKLY